MFIAAGMNSQGIIYGPGAGKALAEWIVSGGPTMDLTEVDVARSGHWSNNRSWLHARTAESLGRLYAMHWPAYQAGTARGVRRLPLVDRLASAGAAFGEAAGWERPAWFEPGATEEPAWGYDFDRPSWFEPVGEEMRVAREGVALFDLSPYSKFLVQGPGALAGLQRACTADVDTAPGRVTYTLLANDGGGIEMDPTVTRLDEQTFLVVAPTLYQRRTEAAIARSLPDDAVLTDVTSAHAVLHVAGPSSRELLQAVTDTDLSNEAFGFRDAKQIEVGWAHAWALRVSFTGELGWELYLPTEFAHGAYDAITAAGQAFGLRHAGAFAFDGLRLERGFRSWGHDMGAIDDPFSAGMGFAVAAGKHDAVGAKAIAARRDAPAERRLVSVFVTDPAPMLWHGEAVLLGGRHAGYVTSGAYGHTLGGAVGLAWVDEPVTGRLDAEVEVRDRRFPAVVDVRPFLDPAGTRLRS